MAPVPSVVVETAARQGTRLVPKQHTSRQVFLRGSPLTVTLRRIIVATERTYL